MSSEMKPEPCPFCGARMIRSDESSNRTRDIYVHELPAAGETNCPAASVILDKNSAEDWNRRVSPQPPAPAGEVVAAAAKLMVAYWSDSADEPIEADLELTRKMLALTTPPTPDADAIRRAALEEVIRAGEKYVSDRRAFEASRGGHPDTATPIANLYWCDELLDAIRALATQPSPDGRG